MSTSTDTPTNKGKGYVFFVFFLIAASGIATLLYPLLQRQFPDITSRIDTARGVYDGPVLLGPPADKASVFDNDHLSDTRILAEDGFDIYFIPATSGVYWLSGTVGMNDLVQVDLHRNDGTLLYSNRRVPYATGRQVGAYTASGDVLPDHAHSMSYVLDAGEVYFVKVSAEDSDTLGKQVKTTLEYEDSFIEMTTIWGMFVGAVIGLYILFILYKFLQWNRTAQATTQTAPQPEAKT
jgi:hypothetical protein